MKTLQTILIFLLFPVIGFSQNEFDKLFNQADSAFKYEYKDTLKNYIMERPYILLNPEGGVTTIVFDREEDQAIKQAENYFRKPFSEVEKDGWKLVKAKVKAIIDKA